MIIDALPERHWQANALYIIGDKPVLQDIPEDLYPNCTFVPVEVRKNCRWDEEGEREMREGEEGREGGREKYINTCFFDFPLNNISFPSY
jgi:hypothetical protein